MTDFISNPRRSPRVPIRCEARVAVKEGGFWASPTSDCGPGGCQLAAPKQVEPGTRLFVELVNPRVQGAIEVAGRVAWCSKSPPWLVGVAFDGPSTPAGKDFFMRLAAAYPGADLAGTAPERIPADAPLAPATPPRVRPELTVHERAVLRDLGAGLRLDALRERSGDAWDEVVIAVFKLVARGLVVLGEPDPAAAERWAPLLSERAA